MAAREYRIGPDQWEHWLERAEGPQLIVAGPGTGKTEFLIRRVAHLIDSGKAKRSEIAMLAFSRRAATDIKRRIDEEIGGSGVPVEATTFHSLALRLLEHNLGARPRPLTAPEQVGLVAKLLAEERPEDWPLTYRNGLTNSSFAGEVADFLMRCSERLLSPESLAAKAEARADWRGIPGLFARYRSELATIQRTDYGTLLVSAVEFLTTKQGQERASQYRFVVVDEYQDTSLAQATMATLLSGPHSNLTVAGDPYQSVYSFRGAELGNLARFTDDHDDSIRIVLDQSFRVSVEILDSALRVVSSGELPGSAGPVNPANHAGRVEAYLFDQETAEAEWIASEVERLVHTEELKPELIAVLVRSKRELLTELSRALTRRGVPHDPPTSRLVDHPAVRLIADLVTVAVLGGSHPAMTPSESLEADRAMRRVLLGPIFRLSLGKERALLRERQATWDSWASVLKAGLPEHPDLSALLEDPSWAVAQPAIDGLWRIWTGLEELASLVSDDGRAEWRRALSSFTQVLGRQLERDGAMTLSRFFELTEDERFEPTPLIAFRPEGGQVTLTTMHQAKGLEFDVVFIANAVEGVFPDLRRGRRMLRPELLSPGRTTDADAQFLFQVQEEMRLAYTAMTRARHRLVWTATQAGVDQGMRRPSRFLVAASGASSIDDLGRPDESEHAPVTLAEFETHLRRRVLDPSAEPVERMAAVRVLGESRRGSWDPLRFAGVEEPGPDRPILGPEIRLSPSQAESYATCPRRYALERRLRIGDADSPYARFGSLVHLVLETAEREVLGTGLLHADIKRVIEILDEIWETANFGSPELNKAWRQKAETALIKLYEMWPSDGIPVEVESRVEHEIAGVPWVGKIDRVERTKQGLKVVDYKSGTKPATKKEAAISVQLGFYVTALEHLREETVCAAEMWYPRTQAKSVTRPSLDLDRLDEVRDLMQSITRGVVAELWEPRINNGCERCGFRRSCPAWTRGDGAFTP